MIPHVAAIKNRNLNSDGVEVLCTNIDPPPLTAKFSRNFMVRMLSKYICKTFLLRTREVCYMHKFMKYFNLQYWKTLRVSHSETTDFVFESLVKQTET